MDFLSSFVPGADQLHKVSFLAEFALVIVAVKMAGHLSRRLGQPSVFGKLLVGLVLGPAVLGWLSPTPFIKEMAEAGVILLMFLAGLETDLVNLRRSGLTATVVALVGVVVPFFGGWAVAELWGFEATTAIFVGTLLVATSVSISVQTLREMGRLNSREGVTILGAAVIDDVLGLVVLSAVLGLTASDGSGGMGPVLALLVKVPLFFGLAVVLGQKVLPPVLRWASRFQVGAPLIAFGIAAALSFAALAEVFGLAGIVGAYICGLVLSASPIKEHLYHELEVTTFAAFTPFFFVSVGLAANVQGMTGQFWVFVLVLVAIAIATKLLGCGLGAHFSGMKGRSALAVGAGMVARGEVGLIMATIGLSRGLITPEVYTAMVLVSLLTTLVTPPMLKAIFTQKSAETIAPTAAQTNE